MKMTESLKKVFELRDMMNQGRCRAIAKDNSCVVYFFTNISGKPCAIGYRGRAKKPAFRYSFQSTTGRAEYVKEWMEGVMERQSQRRERATRQLEVGDVLSASWGYEQTNIDYFLVTKLIGKSMVEIVEIGAQSKQTLSMQGECIPDPNKIIGEPMRRKADGNGVRVSSCIWATKKQPVEILNGVKVFKSDHWTAYH